MASFAHPPLRSRLALRATLSAVVGALLFGCGSLSAQVRVSAAHTIEAGVAGTLVGGNTQFPYYADNAIGFDVAAFLQHSELLGIEVRGGSSPVFARFTQSPITIGYRAGRLHNKGGRILPFGYIGAGASLAADLGPDLKKPAPTSFSPCWQGSFGADIVVGHFAWRAIEASYLQTYTPQRNLRTYSASTGLVFYFGN